MLLALSSLTTMGVVVPAVRTGASLTAVMLVPRVASPLKPSVGVYVSPPVEANCVAVAVIV